MKREKRQQLADAAGVELHEVCGACGTASKDVEASGLWHCPNPQCQGCAGGAARHARTCKACVTREDNTGTILLKPCPVFERDHAPMGGEG